MRCKNCHYQLQRLTDRRCPECGCKFDPDDPSTYLAPGQIAGSRLLPRLLLWSAVVLLAIAVLLMILPAALAALLG